MNIPFCDLERVNGVDITDFTLVSIDNFPVVRFVMSGAGGYDLLTIVRFIVLSEDDEVIKDFVWSRSGRGRFIIYSQCSEVEALFSRIGSGVDSVFTIPDGAKLTVTNIGTSHRLFGWATTTSHGIRLSSLDCDEERLSTITPQGGTTSEAGWWFTHKIFGSGIYGNKPNKYHAHTFQVGQTPEDNFFDFTGIQDHKWNSPVLEIDLTDEQKRRFAYMLPDGFIEELLLS